MSRNGNGTYNLPAGNPVVTGTTISSTWANTTLTDIATALTNSVAADGQTPITGSLIGPTGTVTFGGVGQTRIPSGTTAQRSATPVNGMIRFNTDLNQYEGYRNGSWSIFGNGAGGTLFSDTVTATQGQTLFNLPTGYVQGGDNLSVYVNGSRQIFNVNYTETSTSSFTFASGLNAGDLVNYTIGASTSLSVNAASVLYNEGSTNAVDRNVEQKLQEFFSPKDFGAVGNGVTDDTTAITNLVSALALNGGGTVYLDGNTYYMGASIVDFSALNNVTFIGPGGFKGPAVSVQGQPSLGIKLYGTLGTPVSYSSVINQGTGDSATPFLVSNSFTANQYLLLSNFPTDATDAYTNGTPDIFGNIPRNYANTSSSNLRQTRRKEILQIRSSTLSSFACYWSTSSYYANASTQFQVITMPTNILFDGVTFTNVFIYNWFTNNVSFKSCKAFASNFFYETCINANVDFTNCDFQNTDGKIDFFGSSRFFTITGLYKNNNTPADNAMVKATGSTDYMVDLQASGGLGSGSYGFQADTNFGEDFRGYTDLNNLNYQIKVTSKDMNSSQGVFVATDPYAVATAGEVTNGYGKIEVSSQDCGVILKGCAHVDVTGSIYYKDGFNNSVFLYGTTSCGVFTNNEGNIFSTGTVTNPRGGQVQYNTDCRGFWVDFPTTPIFKGSSTAGTNTYTTQEGKYYRNGNSVSIKGVVQLASTTGMTGNLQLANIPYTSFGSGFGSVNIGAYSGLTLSSGYTQVGGFIQPSTNVITFSQSGSAQTSGGINASTQVSGTASIIYNVQFEV